MKNKKYEFKQTNNRGNGLIRNVDYDTPYCSLNPRMSQIKSIKENNNTVRSYSYNSFGQPLTVIETIDMPYTTSYTYNTKGQMLTKTSPSGLTISYGYDTNGFLNSLKNAANNTPIWTLNAMNAFGQIEKSTQGNGLTRNIGYDTYHLPNKIVLRNGTTAMDSVMYAFNGITGNLTSRNDYTNGGGNESFTYDNLNRLSKIGSGVIQYDNNGNITNKFNVGAYAYTNGKPHAVSDITLNTTTAQTGMTHNITNTSYNRVSSIKDPNSFKEVKFTYNPDNQRNMMVHYEGATPSKTTYYVGNYEKVVNHGGTTEEFDYIYTPEGLSAIAKKTNSGQHIFYYVNTDHLGSIRTITKADKTLETRYVYDAWGKRDVAPTFTSFTTHGYTGHEHLPEEFGLINMNARMYDPVLGRFLEVDPYVPTPNYTQGYNRYAYAMNNPLIYIDPSGEELATAVAMGIGYAIAAVIFYFANAKRNTPAGKDPDVVNNWALNPRDWGENGFLITVGFNPGGGDINVSATYFNNGYQVTAGVSKGDNYFSYGGKVVFPNSFGVSYYRTNFGGNKGYDGYSNRQVVGEVGLYYEDISVRIANDKLGDGKDRWRSNAIEIGIGNYTIGTLLYNNNPEGEAAPIEWTREGPKKMERYYEQSDSWAVKRNGNFNKTFRGTEFSAWKNGKTYTSPLYIGYRNGSYTMRVGYSHPAFQDGTQNWVHRNGFLYLPVGHQHFYNDYSAFQRGTYFYSGYHNPYSLYTR